MAPIDGVVSTRTVQFGQMVSSAISNVGGGTATMVLSDLSHMFVYASVDESDIGAVVVDQPAEITADAHPGKRFKGKVVRIATKGVNVTNVITFEVRIEVTSENKSLLKPEMTANVNIVTADKDSTLSVPATAITRQKGQSFVTVKKSVGSSEQVPVEVGMTEGSNVEILSGVNENDEVILQRSELDSRWRAGADQRKAPPVGMMMGAPRGGRR
jgi:RND family efflux transporter MFP subunit